MGFKRNYRFKGDNQEKEKRLFWIVSIIVSLIFLALYYFMN